MLHDVHRQCRNHQAGEGAFSDPVCGPYGDNFIVFEHHVRDFRAESP